MTMTQMTLETTIREHTCRLCGEEFPTVAEKIDHDCEGGPSSAQGRLNALLDSLPDGDAIRSVENLHRDRVNALSEADAAQMIRQVVNENRPAAAAARLDAAVAAVSRPRPTNARANRYAASCGTCGQTVEVGEGWITRNQADTAWRTTHNTCPEAPAAPATPTVRFDAADGQVHRIGDAIYRVRTSRSTRRLYVQRARVHTYTDYLGDTHTDVDWTYAQGAMRLLTDATLLTWEQAREFGLLTSQCVRCSRALNDLRSVAAGYGETCAGHMGWPYPNMAEAEQMIADRSAR